MCEREEDRDAVSGGAGEGGDAIVLSDTVSLSDSSDAEDNIAGFDPEVEDLSSSSGGEGGEEEEDSVDGGGRPPQAASSREPFFRLKGTSAVFSSRSQSIFDCLESAAKLAAPSLGEDNLVDGAFVRPLPPPPERRRREAEEGARPPGKTLSPNPRPLTSKGVPDYLAHPERWTKYSLEDVPETSGSRNAAVAKEYIEGLQRRRGRGAWAPDHQESFTPAFNQDQSSSSDCRIVFSKPRSIPEEEEEDGEEERPRPGKGVRQREKDKKEVGLLHLEELEEEMKAELEKAGRSKQEAEKRKRAREQQEEEEEEEEEEEMEGRRAGVGFNANRKVNRKNFRKTVEREEDE
ncbi:U5 small nuclear ribonucleoprotein TSSC4 [Amia ocellicauda]|uniref:U5 small nuclear ribonucleoprotein TSSC4 n=1 Tax=Amia ocellicauda TaxID=2972642 RepID=UPI003463EDD6